MPQALDSAELWLALTTLLLTVLAASFVYLLARRHRDVVFGALQRLDVRLSARMPRLWGFLKGRFTRHAPLGLGLTVAAALFFGAVYLFAEVTDGWTEQEELYRIDRIANERLVDAFSSGPWLQVLRLVTHFGAVPMMLVVSAGLALWLWRRRARWELLALLLVSAGGQALLWSLKWIYARPRPGEGLTSSVGYSFPSGHSFTSMVLYGFILYLVWQHTERRTWRVLAALLLSLLVLAVGVSRVLLSVHWVSDVLGGCAIGLAWLVFSLTVAHVLETYRTRPAAL